MLVNSFFNFTVILLGAFVLHQFFLDDVRNDLNTLLFPLVLLLFAHAGPEGRHAVFDLLFVAGFEFWLAVDLCLHFLKLILCLNHVLLVLLAHSASLLSRWRLFGSFGDFLFGQTSLCGLCWA